MSGGPKPLSARLQSSATTAFAKARQRLPLAWVVEQFQRLARALAGLAVAPAADRLPVRLLDGSTLRLRPHGALNLLAHEPHPGERLALLLQIRNP